MKGLVKWICYFVPFLPFFPEFSPLGVFLFLYPVSSTMLLLSFLFSFRPWAPIVHITVKKAGEEFGLIKKPKGGRNLRAIEVDLRFICFVSFRLWKPIFRTYSRRLTYLKRMKKCSAVGLIFANEAIFQAIRGK